MLLYVAVYISPETVQEEINFHICNLQLALPKVCQVRQPNPDIHELHLHAAFIYYHYIAHFNIGAKQIKKIDPINSCLVIPYDTEVLSRSVHLSI